MNGLGLTLEDTMEIIREASYLNGSLGWLVQIGNGGNYFASCFEENKALRLFSEQKNVIAGSGTPSGMIEIQANGYLVSGIWKYCSGADYAELFTISFIDPLTHQKLAAVVPKKDVHVLTDWNTIGLRHTSTHSIELTNVHVPKEHVFDVEQQLCLKDDPAFSMPFVIYAQAFFLQVVFGITERILDETKGILKEKRELWQKVYPTKIERLNDLTERNHLSLLSYCKRTQEIRAFYQNGGDPSQEESHRKELVHYSKWLRIAMHELVSELGIAVIYENHPISIFYRDLIVASQHYLLNE
jgi:hypothetical protein